MIMEQDTAFVAIILFMGFILGLMFMWVITVNEVHGYQGQIDALKNTSCTQEKNQIATCETAIKQYSGLLYNCSWEVHDLKTALTTCKPICDIINSSTCSEVQVTCKIKGGQP